MIEVKNLTYEYPGHRALENISFNINRGSITALVGPNGAGKTTFLRCLAALTKPFEGTIHINGVDVIENPQQAHKMLGFLNDFFGLYDNLTVKKALTYFSLAHNMDENLVEERVEKVIAKLNLTDKTNSKISELSRGMRQRVGIGQAIIHNPELLILDEPASGLDPEARHALAQLFLELNASGMTIIVSSHILAELDQYANNLIILREGKVKESNISSATQTVKRKLTMLLSQMDPMVESLLQEHDKVEDIKVEQNRVNFIFSGDSHEQYMLLKKLMDNDMKVSEFYVKKANIQEQYLDLIKK